MPGQTLPCAALWGALSQINDVPVTGRDQEVVTARTGGPKVFCQNFPPWPRLLGVSFMDLVVELDSTRASAGWGWGPPQLGFARN